jgi:hypothetical protein
MLVYFNGTTWHFFPESCHLHGWKLCHKGVWGNDGKAPCIPDFGNGICITLWLLYQKGKSPTYSINRKFGTSHSQNGYVDEEKSNAFAWNQTIHFVITLLLLNWAVPDHYRYYDIQNSEFFRFITKCAHKPTSQNINLKLALLHNRTKGRSEQTQLNFLCFLHHLDKVNLHCGYINNLLQLESFCIL